jgi:hypothetical protein
VKPADYQSKLTVVDPDEDRAAAVTTAGFGPFADDASKIGNVKSDEDAIFRSCEGKDFVVIPFIQAAVFINCLYVVPEVTKCSSDPRA